MNIKHVHIGGTLRPMRRFNPASMCKNPSIVMVAKRGSGKSILCRDILKHSKDIPGGVIISGTEKLSQFYGEFFPDLYIHYEYKTELIEKILYRQDNMKRKVREKALMGKKIDARAFIVMDDCLADKGSWAKDRPIFELFFNGRHYELMYILTMQFPLGIKPELRSNFDYIFLMNTDFVSDQKRLYDHYAGMFSSLKEFKSVFRDVTNEYGCMVINNRTQAKDILDKVFWYKADINKKIDKMGNEQFNLYHKFNYNKNYKDRKVDRKVDRKSIFGKDEYHVKNMPIGKYNNNDHHN